MMRHTFDWSSNIGDFFFKGLTINTLGSMCGLCVIIGLLAIVYESMKVYSAKVRARAARERLRTPSCAPSETANLISSDVTGRSQIPFAQRFCKLLSEASVFFLHNSLAYGLMLSVMIYNGYVFVTVILGMGLGYFLFGHVSMKINMENMQARTTKVICSPVCPPEFTSGNASVHGQSDSNGRSDEMRPSTSKLSHDTSFKTLEESSNSSSRSNVTDTCRL